METTKLVQIVALSYLLSQGKKVCFVKGNRQVSKKNVASKVESIKRNGIITPLMFVKGSKAIADGCSLVNLDGTNIDAVDAVDYIVIIDGQNRYSAAIEAKLLPDQIPLFEYAGEMNTKTILSESNIEVVGWKAKDFINGAVLNNPTNELAQFAIKLSDKNFPISNIGKILTFKDGIKAKVFSEIMKGNDVKVEYDLERAELFLKSTAKFNDLFVGKRYLIDGVIGLSTTYGYSTVCSAISKLSDETIKTIEASKGEAITPAIKAAIQTELTTIH